MTVALHCEEGGRTGVLARRQVINTAALFDEKLSTFDLSLFELSKHFRILFAVLLVLDKGQERLVLIVSPLTIPALVDLHSLASAPKVLNLFLDLFAVLYSLPGNRVDVVACEDVQRRVAVDRLVRYVNFVLLNEEFEILERVLVEV